MKSIFSREISVTPVKTPGPPTTQASSRTPSSTHTSAAPGLDQPLSGAAATASPHHPPHQPSASRGQPVQKPHQPITLSVTSLARPVQSMPNLPQHAAPPAAARPGVLAPTRLPDSPVGPQLRPQQQLTTRGPAPRLPSNIFVDSVAAAKAVSSARGLAMPLPTRLPPPSSSGTTSPPVLHLPETSFGQVYTSSSKLLAISAVGTGGSVVGPALPTVAASQNQSLPLNPQLAPTNLDSHTLQKVLALHHQQQHQRQQQQQQQQALVQKQLEEGGRNTLLNPAQQQQAQLRQLQFREIQQQVINAQQQQLLSANQPQQQHLLSASQPQQQQRPAHLQQQPQAVQRPLIQNSQSGQVRMIISQQQQQQHLLQQHQLIQQQHQTASSGELVQQAIESSLTSNNGEAQQNEAQNDYIKLNNNKQS